MAILGAKTAIVTGGNRGIGRAIAEAMVNAGMRVAIASRTETHAVDAAGALCVSSGRAGAAIGIACDVRHHEDCASLIRGAVAAFGRLDVLVNNAGIGAFEPVETMEAATWDAVLETNLSGVFYCTREAIPHLKASGDAWIMNIGSLAGKNAFPGGGAYNASKFGLIGFSEALMQEVRHDGIRVSCIMPGSVATEFNNHAPGSDDSWRIAPEDVAQVVMDLLAFPTRSLPSRIELRPSRPPRR